MKKLYVPLFMLVLCLAVACMDEVERMVLDRGELEFIGGKNNLSFYSEGGSADFYFETGDSWTIVNDLPWLEISPVSGQGGMSAVTVNAADWSDGEESRNGSFTIVTSGKRYEVQVLQSAEGQLVIAEPQYVVGMEGGTVEIPVSHNMELEVKLTDDWITSIPTKGMSSSTLKFNVASNASEDASPRIGQIRFSTKDGGASQMVEVAQEGKDFIRVSREEYLVSAFDDLSYDIDILTNLDDVKVSLVGADTDWLIVSKLTAKTDRKVYEEMKCSMFLMPNEDSPRQRKAIVRFSSPDGTVTKDVAVTQLSAETVEVEKSLYKVSSQAQELTVRIAGQQELYISANTPDEQLPPWLTLVEDVLEVKSAAPADFKEFRFQVAENTGGPREIYLDARFSYNQSVSDGFMIFQEGQERLSDDLSKLLVEKGFDTSNDGTLSQEELDKVLELTLYDNIDLTGISLLQNLEYLSATSLKNSYLDLSGNANLEKICLGDFNHLDLHGLKKLKDFVLYTSPAVELDFSGLTALETFKMSPYDSYQLESLDFSGCTALKTVKVCSAPIKKLDFTGCGNLESLKAGDDGDILSLDLKDCTKLKELYLKLESLKTLDLSKCAELHTLELSYMSIPLDLSGTDKLVNLRSYKGSLYSLQILDKPLLEVVNIDSYVYQDKLTVRNCPLLKELHISDGGFSNLELDLPSLTDLTLSEVSSLKQMSLNAPELQSFNLNSSELDILDMSLYPELKSLTTSNNNFYMMDLSGNPVLESVFMNEDLTDIELDNPLLKNLDLSNNLLRTVDLSKCVALESAELYMNTLEKVYIYDGFDTSKVNAYSSVEFIVKTPSVQ